jgi:uncharacterized protein
MLERLRASLPTRESIAGNRWLKPFAGPLMQPGLWRFNRRSVPRAVGLGLLAGLTVPVAHTVIAAVLAIPLRANIVIAAGITWVSNPFTWLLIFPAEKWLGAFALHLRSVSPAPQATDAMQGWLGWLLQTSGEIALGSVILASVAATIGYVLTVQLWKWRTMRRWRRRRVAHG